MINRPAFVPGEGPPGRCTTHSDNTHSDNARSGNTHSDNAHSDHVHSANSHSAKLSAITRVGESRSPPHQLVSGSRHDQGVATVFVCMGAALVIAVTAMAIQLGAAVLARQRAETAADLAALAGAAAVLRGPDLVCALAVKVAVANGATVESCVVQGTDVLVSVVAGVEAGPVSGTVSAHARAGPVQQITDDA